MPSKITIKATPTKLAAAFAEWERLKRSEPEKFEAAAKKLLSETPETHGIACADYFMKVLAHVELLGSGPLIIIVEADPPNRLTLSSEETVYDVSRGLEWSRATLSSKCVNHETATKIASDCRLGGHTDWRLPTIKELLTLVDYERRAPTIDTNLFPDTKSDWYWSSSLYAGVSDGAWCVHFGYGYAGCSYRGGSYGLVRAVRSVGASSPGQ